MKLAKFLCAVVVVVSFALAASMATAGHTDKQFSYDFEYIDTDAEDDSGGFVEHEGDYSWDGRVWAEADISDDNCDAGKTKEKITIELYQEQYDASFGYYWMEVGEVTAKASCGRTPDTESKSLSWSSGQDTGDYKVDITACVYYADYAYPDDWDWKCDSTTKTFSG